MKLLNLLIIKVKRAIIKCMYLIDMIHLYKKIKKFRHELDYVKKKNVIKKYNKWYVCITFFIK